MALLAKAIEAGVLAADRLSRTSPTAVDRALLIDLRQNGEQAFCVMVERNLRLVISIARSFVGKGAPFEDLLQSGNLGLVGAVQRFDFTMGIKFSTYATWWIRKAISDEIAQARMVRLPARVTLQLNLVALVRYELSVKSGRPPTVAELAGELDMTTESLEEFDVLTREPSSLNRPIAEDQATEYGSMLVDATVPAVEDQVCENLLQRDLNAVLESLPPLEVRVIRLRFGIGDTSGMGYREIARELAITEPHVRHLEKVAMAKLSHPSRRTAMRALS